MLFRACTVLALLLRGSDALTVADHPESVLNAQEGCGRVVEQLKNVGGGAAYMGKIYIGHQALDAIWDTGSDQQVVNSLRTYNPSIKHNCFLGDNKKHCYDPAASGQYSLKQALPKIISYGSGDTTVLVGEDEISLVEGQCKVQKSQFMELLNTNIPQILGHTIDVVAGLSPHRWGDNQQLMKDMGIQHFAFCFHRDTEKEQESGGIIVWNDHPAKNHPEFSFNVLPTIGEGNYWSVPVADVKLEHNSYEGSTTLGYTDEKAVRGCIVDTGTSLITLDRKTLKNLETELNTFMEKSKFECSEENLHKLPDLTFRLGDKKIEHRLKPEDYITYASGTDLPQEVIGALKWWGTNSPLANKNKTDAFIDKHTKKECMLMFTQPMQDNVCLLGMPFMRNYYVQFDREQKTVNTALHNGKCEATKGFRQVEPQRQRLRSMDASKMVLSNAFKSLRQQSLLEAGKDQKAISGKMPDFTGGAKKDSLLQKL